ICVPRVPAAQMSQYELSLFQPNRPVRVHFVLNVPVLRGTNSSGSPVPADSRTSSPDVPFASGLFVLISADPASS
ncbi:hypothetical protein KI387_000472, partial [Taxus chinensis]